MDIAQFDCPECGESAPLRHTVNSTCGGLVPWTGGDRWVSGDLQCESCGTLVHEFRCGECGENVDHDDCLNGPSRPTRRERRAEAEAAAEREAEQHRRRQTGTGTDSARSESTGGTKGCRAIPGALGATVFSGVALGLFAMLFGGGDWGYSGCFCCSLVGFAFLATLGAWQSVFK